MRESDTVDVCVYSGTRVQKKHHRILAFSSSSLCSSEQSYHNTSEGIITAVVYGQAEASSSTRTHSVAMQVKLN